MRKFFDRSHYLTSSKMSPAPMFDGAVPSSNMSTTDQAKSLAPANHAAVVTEATPPASPRTPTSPSMPTFKSPLQPGRSRPIVSRAPASFISQPAPPPGGLHPPATLKGIDASGEYAEDWDDSLAKADMVLELADGLALAGHSFGAKKSVAGECVFQTGASRTRGSVDVLAHPRFQEWSDIPSP